MVAPADQDLGAVAREIAELLRQVTGEDDEWVAGVGPATRVDVDLVVDSIELAELSLRVQQRFGPGVDLAAHVADLELPELLELTIGDLAAYVVARS